MRGVTMMDADELSNMKFGCDVATVQVGPPLVPVVVRG